MVSGNQCGTVCLNCGILMFSPGVDVHTASAMSGDAHMVPMEIIGTFQAI